MFLHLPHKEAFYGGSAGGGKSDALLRGALQYVDVPGYAAILFRRTFADLALPGALMDRAHSWLAGTDAHWNGQEKTWRFPSGATVSFGYLETVNKDKYRYQGSEFQYIGFDELTQFDRQDWNYLFSRLRRKDGVKAPLRMRSASNPGGAGHDWVKERYVDPGHPKRPFVPARLTDNPSLDTAEYTESLNELDHITRRQLLDGDWTARHGGSLFQREWFTFVREVPAHAKRVRYWDLASTEKTDGNDPDWTVGTLMSRTASGIFTIEDVARVRARPESVESLVVGQASMDGPGVAIRIEQEPGASGKSQIAHYVKRLAGYDVKGDRPSGDKRTRAVPLSAQAEAGNVHIRVAPWNGALMDEYEGFDGSGETGHDDQVDSGSGALNHLTIMARSGWGDV